jgi:Fic family protein
MNIQSNFEHLLTIMRKLAAEGRPRVSSSELAQLAGISPATVKRQLHQLVESGAVNRTGQARSTRYGLALNVRAVPQELEIAQDIEPYLGTSKTLSPNWSEASKQLRAALSVTLAARDPVTYKRKFVDDYVPNQTSLLPESLARELAIEGRMHGQQPAGTYARKVLEQLLIDLSWSSSRLEGNRYTLLDTVELFKSGMVTGDADSVMLLNHKRAIEFLVDAVPEYGLNAGLVRNLHAVLMQDLLSDSDALGAIRHKVVNISHSVYVPAQNPALLAEMFEAIINKARLIKNPLESAFFLWINLAYLQPFDDGNKRCSRLAANIPLMLYNCAPLSFLDVGIHDYALAAMGVYERLDVSMAVDLFTWSYRRSLSKYKVVLEATGAPDPVRLRYRETLNEVIQLVVRERKTIADALQILNLTEESVPGFRALLVVELRKLDVFNCARYRLAMSATEAWISDGRPQ